MSEPRHFPAAGGSPWRAVAVPAAVALGAIGAIAAMRANLPPLLGGFAGALAAVLAVLALPSIPTRRATVLLLGVGGLAALRHSSFPGADAGLLLVLWAGGTLVSLVMVDRADAEATPALPGGASLPGRAAEAVRVSCTLAALVVVVTVVSVPAVADRLGRHVWPGAAPGFSDAADAPASLRAGDRLDMTTRPRLSDQLVFTVDAPRGDFWRGQTFDEWDGRTWTRSYRRRLPLPHDGDHVRLAVDPFDAGAQRGVEMRQTFRVEASFSDLVFAAPSPVVVETDRFVRGVSDGTASVAANPFGRGAVYTVTSRSLLPTADALRASDTRPVPPRVLDQYAHLDAHATTPRVRALAREITARAPTTFDKIKSIEAWLGSRTRYSLKAPLSPRGVVDVVDDFLFRSREGWCEQIASSLTVLARSVGIPARLATGFVPGDRDPLTGRFAVRERDAHSWTEVYFPGVGWQGFDPTASVPLAGEAHAGGSWLQVARRHVFGLGVAAAAVVLAAGMAPDAVAASRRRRRRRATWGARTLARLERIGRHAGRPRAPAETPREYARALAVRLGDARLDAVGDTLDRDQFSAHAAPSEARAAADAVLTSIRP